MAGNAANHRRGPVWAGVTLRSSSLIGIECSLAAKLAAREALLRIVFPLGTHVALCGTLTREVTLQTKFALISPVPTRMCARQTECTRSAASITVEATNGAKVALMSLCSVRVTSRLAQFASSSSDAAGVLARQTECARRAAIVFVEPAEGATVALLSLFGVRVASRRAEGAKAVFSVFPPVLSPDAGRMPERRLSAGPFDGRWDHDAIAYGPIPNSHKMRHTPIKVEEFDVAIARPDPFTVT
eukprot:2459488-Prymnesium_polylepis.1